MTGRLLTKITVIAACLALPAWAACDNQAPEAVRLLEPGEAVEAALTGDGAGSYRVELSAGEYLQASVEQQGIDVTVLVFGPGGRLELEVDRPIGAYGVEEVYYVGALTGIHELRIVPFEREAKAGRYRIEIAARRPAAETDLARVLLDRAERLHEEGNPSSIRAALDSYSEALTIWESHGFRAEAASTQRGMGNAWLQLGDGPRAAEALERSLAAFEELDDSSSRASVSNDLGLAFDYMGEADRSLQHHRAALSFSRLAGDRAQEAESLMLVGQRLAARGRTEEALAGLEEAVGIWRGLRRLPRLVDALTEVGRTYSLLGRMEESFDGLQEALALSQDLGHVRRQVRALTELGWSHHLEGNAERAIELLRRAVELSEADGRLGPPGTLDRLGSAYRDAGRLEEALAAYRRALALMGRESELFRAHTIANLAELYLRREAPEEALANFAQAIRVFERAGDVHALAHARFLSGLAHRRLGRLEEARTQLEATLDIIESVRFRVRREAFLDALQTVSFGYYQAYVDLLMEMHSRNPASGFDRLALAAAERTRARRLEEAWRAKGPWQRAAEASESARRVESLRARIDAQDRYRIRLMESGAPKAMLEAVDQQLHRQLLELDAAESEARKTLGAAPPLDLQQIQNLLEDDSVLLYYALGADRSFLWRVDLESVKSFVLAPANVIEGLARRLHSLFNKRPSPAGALQRELFLQRLAEELLGPVAAELGGRRLLVAPDASMMHLPFAALPLTHKPLVRHHEIIYLPSAGSLGLLERSSRSRKPESIAVFADPVFSAADVRVRPVSSGEAGPLAEEAVDLQRSAKDLGYTRFERLAHSREEAAAVLGLFPAEKRLEALDFDASRDAVLRLDLDRFQILHFATHSLLHPRYPELSGIVLSLVDPDGRPREGFLRAHDIARLRLNAELVVLSACATARGREIPGEGVIGLPDSFMKAGVPGVVVSQWRVDDEATAELMKRFYNALIVERLPAAAALREAQRSMLSEAKWEDPYHWAGFIFFGRSSQPLGEGVAR